MCFCYSHYLNECSNILFSYLFEQAARSWWRLQSAIWILTCSYGYFFRWNHRCPNGSSIPLTDWTAPHTSMSISGGEEKTISIINAKSKRNTSACLTKNNKSVYNVLWKNASEAYIVSTHSEIRREKIFMAWFFPLSCIPGRSGGRASISSSNKTYTI